FNHMRSALALTFKAALTGSVMTTTLLAQGRGVPMLNKQDTMSVRTTMNRARGLLESADFRNAELAYSSVINMLPNDEPVLLAAAHFGTAFALQQRFMNGDTLLNHVTLEDILVHYRAADSLNSTAFGAEADNNLGVVFRSVGQHAEAIRYFRAAAAITTSANDLRASFLTNLGGEFEALNQIDSAAASYTAAVAAASNRTPSLQALYSLLVRSFPPERLINSAMKWCQDTTYAPEVSASLLRLLQREDPAIDSVRAVDALLLMAGTWAVTRVGPQYYGAVLRSQLAQVAIVHPWLRAPIAAIDDAYTLRSEKQPFENKGAEWWLMDDAGATRRLAVSRPKTDGPPAPIRMAIWSSLLRSMGDQYEQRGNLTVARSFYEAALGGTEFKTEAPWADRGALLPLAIIYARLSKSSDSASESAVRLQRSIDRFTQQLFMSKMAAYGAGDLQRIHDLHQTLGTFYAATGKWSSPDAQNATYQLEHMQKASASLRQQTGKIVSDPPDLLEKLAVSYRVTGDTAKASSLTTQIETQYRVHGNVTEAAAVRGRIYDARTTVVPPKTNLMLMTPPPKSDTESVKTNREKITVTPKTSIKSLPALVRKPPVASDTARKKPPAASDTTKKKPPTLSPV
ncbi:MAG: tetratricopeptide repeat protein, partial [Gemmatimonadota bacterium]|nr:tetratricopeptide repeat protein [Gemmatimonadota bacterium]